MTLLELAERIRLVASTGAAQDSPLLNVTTIIEVILPKVFQMVVSQAAMDDTGLNALRANHTLSITSGVVSCPQAIREDYIESVVFTSAPLTSYQPTALDFSEGDSLFDTFYVADQNIYFREAGLSANTYTGVKQINAITLPTFPASPSDTVNLKDHLLQKVITLAASVIRGEVPLSTL